MNATPIEIIKQSLSILSVAEHYGVELTKSGPTTYKAKTNPLRDERSSSLFFYVDTNRYNDYGSNENGDALDFICKMELCTLLEAVKIVESIAQNDDKVVVVPSGTSKTYESSAVIEAEFNMFEKIDFDNDEHAAELEELFPAYLWENASELALGCFQEICRYSLQHKSLAIATYDPDGKMVSYRIRRDGDIKWKARYNTPANKYPIVSVFSEDNPFYILEGQHDALTAILLGIDFLAIPSASYVKFSDNDLELLVDREVVFVPDIDSGAGLAVMAKLAEQATKVTSSVKMVDLNEFLSFIGVTHEEAKLDFSDAVLIYPLESFLGKFESYCSTLDSVIAAVAIDAVADNWLPIMEENPQEDEALADDAMMSKSKAIVSKSYESEDAFEVSPFVDGLIKAIRAETPASKDLILSAILSYASIVIGNKVFIKNGGGENLFPNIWAIGIAPSSAGLKSTVIQKCENAILKEIHMIDPMIRLTINSGTIQSLLLKLQQQEGGVLYSSGEISGLFARFNKEPEDKIILTDLFDCRTFNKFLVGMGEGKEIHIDKPFLSIFGVSNFTWIQNHANSEDFFTGFLNRFLWCEVTDTPDIKAYEFITLSDYSPFQSYAAKLYTALSSLTEPREMFLTDEAKRAYKRWFDEFANAKKADEILSSFRIRLGNYALKFGMILSLFDDIDAEEINLECIQKSIELSEHFYKHAVSIIEKLKTSKSTNLISTSIIKYLKTKTNKKVRGMKSGISALRDIDSAVIQKVCDDLVAEGKLTKNGDSTYSLR